jgi:hypothetical protein
VFSEPAIAVPDAKYRSQKAVRKLLEDADEKRWWSLSNDFCLLAEASPEALLDALEQALRADSRSIMALFRSDEGFIHRIEYLAELMWAVEILAWNPDYLGRAALILAQLAELDPGGSFSNRPDATLRTIFLPRSPRTFASMAERMEVVDAVMSKHPSVGWKLLVALAPRVHPIIEPSAFPTWRDFSAETAARPSSLSENHREIGARMVTKAGTDLKRWSDMFDHWNGFDAEWRKSAEDALSGVIDAASPEQRVAFREMLRRLIGKHEQFPQADWTLKADALAPLKTLYERLEPTDPIVRHGWLFGAPDYKFRSDRNWHEMQKEAEEARHAAADQILATASPEAIIAMAKKVRNPRLLGDAVAAAAVSDETKDDILERALPDSGMEEFVRGMLSTLRLSRGESWLLDRLEKGAERNEDPDLLARLAVQLNPERRNWDAIERAGADIATRYWKRMNAFASDSKADPDYVIEKLLAVDSGRAAMTWIAANPTMPVPASLVASVLRHPSTINGGGIQDGDMFQHEATELFKRLDADASFSKLETAGLEWTYYRLLEHGLRPAKCLEEAIAADPSFFVRLLADAYRAEGEEQPPEFSESERKIARQAFHVLKGWSKVPGIKEDGEIDAEALGSWVEEVLRLARDKRRTAVAECKIGAILSKAPSKEGVPWPPEAVQRIIEHVGSKELENGFFVAEQNKHGSTVRRTTEGGSIERDIASRYRSLAKVAGIASVRTRALLNMLAESYQREAEEEDRSAERRDW